MQIKSAFGQAFKKVRNTKNLTQEDFGIVSSRTYVSTLERGLKSVTLEKLVELSSVIDVHPITLLCLTYMEDDKTLNPQNLLMNISKELTDFAENK